jgi:hypothetical protein
VQTEREGGCVVWWGHGRGEDEGTVCEAGLGLFLTWNSLSVCFV